MCIPTRILREISQEGWLDLLGRTGENLSSGEDTELCNKVFRKGYTYICDYRMQMQHLIPRSRLSQENVDRLLEGLMKSRYQLISAKSIICWNEWREGQNTSWFIYVHVFQPMILG